MNAKIKSSFLTSLFETALYSIGVMFYILLNIVLGNNKVSIYENNNLRDCSISFLVVLTSIFIARLLGASSFVEVMKNGKSREVSITMVVGGSIGLITFLLLKVV